MKFNYEVLAVYSDTKTMDVRFTAENEDAVTVAMPLPKVDEDLREIMAGFSPVNHWEHKKASTQDIQVGATGTVWSEHPTENIRSW